MQSSALLKSPTLPNLPTPREIGGARGWEQGGENVLRGRAARGQSWISSALVFTSGYWGIGDKSAPAGGWAEGGDILVPDVLNRSLTPKIPSHTGNPQ